MAINTHWWAGWRASRGFEEATRWVDWLGSWQSWVRMACGWTDGRVERVALPQLAEHHDVRLKKLQVRAPETEVVNALYPICPGSTKTLDQSSGFW